VEKGRAHSPQALYDLNFLASHGNLKAIDGLLILAEEGSPEAKTTLRSLKVPPYEGKGRLSEHVALLYSLSKHGNTDAEEALNHWDFTTLPADPIEADNVRFVLATSGNQKAQEWAAGADPKQLSKTLKMPTLILELWKQKYAQNPRLNPVTHSEEKA